MKANVYIKYAPKLGVFLYTQKRGAELPKIVQGALARNRDKWGDTVAISRAIFTQMIEKDLSNSAAFGITPVIIDNDAFIIVVDDPNEQVGIFYENGKLYRRFSYVDFMGLEKADLEWRRLTSGEAFDRGPAINPNANETFVFENPVIRT